VIWVLAAVLVVALVVVVTRPPRGDPDAGAVRDAAAALFGGDCPSAISVREIDSLGGPGLPEEMNAAHEIVCEADVNAAQPEDETGHPSIAVHFVFDSSAAARRWMEGPDYQAGDWWLRDGTLIAAGTISTAQWNRLARRAALR
jgi:hypothetical protein